MKMKKVELEKIIEIINNNCNFHITKDQVDESLTDLGMDSIAFIQVIVAVESVFECEIPDSKLMLMEMDTVKKIVDTLQILYEDERVNH
jgi:acyl carrier protein